MSYKNTQKKRSSGCGQNYYSVDDILAKHEKLPCKVEMPIHRLGKLIRKKMNLQVRRHDLLKTSGYETSQST